MEIILCGVFQGISGGMEKEQEHDAVAWREKQMQSRWQNSFYRRVVDRRSLGFLGRISEFHWSGLASFLLCNSLTPGLGTCTSYDGHQQRVPVLTPQGEQLCPRPGAALGLPWWKASLSPAFGAQSSIFPRTEFLLLSSLCSYPVSDPTTPTFLQVDLVQVSAVQGSVTSQGPFSSCHLASGPHARRTMRIRHA